MELASQSLSYPEIETIFATKEERKVQLTGNQRNIINLTVDKDVVTISLAAWPHHLLYPYSVSFASSKKRQVVYPQAYFISLHN